MLLDVERRKSHDTDLERTISSINDYKIVRVCSCVFQGSPGTQVMYADTRSCVYVLACFRVLLGRKLCTSLLILTMKGRIRWLGVLFLACREIDARLGRGLQTSSIKARRMPTEANLKDMPLCCVKKY